MDWDGASYDRVSSPQAQWGQVVLGRLELEGDETVLDAGCGTGRVTQELLARLPRGHVIAMDRSPSMLAQARERLGTGDAGGTGGTGGAGDAGGAGGTGGTGEAAGQARRLSYLEADLLDLSPTKLGGLAPLDAVFSTATFHWVTDHETLFSNIRSVLRPGGQLVAQCGGEGNITRVVEAVRSLGVERAGTWLYASPEQTARRLQEAGFEVVAVWSHPELVGFEDEDALVEFLSTVCLREHLASVPPPGRPAFSRKVAQAMAEPVIDYVRLNIVARAS